MIRSRFRIRLALVVLMAVTMAGGVVRADIPAEVSYQGRLLQNGAPVNGTADLTGTNGNISSDPVFDGLTYYLAAGSPCIDRGDPSDPSDPDGSRVDMGAFGGHDSSEVWVPGLDFVFALLLLAVLGLSARRGKGR